MSEQKIRHWFIQKPIVHNCPVKDNAAVFEEFVPTVVTQNCEWVKVFSADDIHKTIGMGLSRYVFIMEENGKLTAENAELKKDLENLQLALSEENLVKIILEWKHFWMNQTQNSEEDRKNYFNRAFGVDANMKYHLAQMISEQTLLKLKGSSVKIGTSICCHGTPTDRKCELC